MPKEFSDSVKIYYPEFSREELLSLFRERTKELSEKLLTTGLLALL
jgi:hypothetical protein